MLLASLVHWIRHFSPMHTDECYFRHSWRWHLSLLFGASLGLVAQRLARLPGGDIPLEVICIARKVG